MKTLREVTKIVGLSRRMIQEYESRGLANKPTARNKYGHFLYSEQEIERLWQLKFYQELKYNRGEIEKIFKDTNYNKHEAIAKQITELEKKKEMLEVMIEVAKAMVETGVNPVSLSIGFSGVEESNFDTLTPVIGTAMTKMQKLDLDIEAYLENLSEIEYGKWMEALENIVNLGKKGYLPESEEIQKQVIAIYRVYAKNLVDSLKWFFWSHISLAEGNRDADDIDEEWGKGSAQIIYESVKYYCSMNEEREADRKLDEALERLYYLGKSKYAAESAEVQKEVLVLYDFFAQMRALTDDVCLQILEVFGELYDTKAYKNFVDNGAEKGVSSFVSEAIRNFIQKRRMSE